MIFIDLFAGLGGFHLALANLGHHCVFASEVDPVLCNLYEKNFGLRPKGDIRKIEASEIPDHDILCAGFPCTPYSKAGKRSGKDHEQGDLLGEIIRILKVHRPKYFILENVPTLLKHKDEKGQNIWDSFENILINEIKYFIKKNFYSPHEFGIPQNRKRVFIVGSTTPLDYFNGIDEIKKDSQTSIKSILDNGKAVVKPISKKQINCIKVWQEFLNSLPDDLPLPFPVWAQEFGATYPFENKTPHATKPNILSRYKGSFGVSLRGFSKKDQLLRLPKYARVEQDEFPEWKKHFIRENRKLYSTHKREINKILKEIINLSVPSWQKFEWNCPGKPRIIKNYILQFRSSGLRVKNIETAPSLVCPNTQIPIIGWENRYISIKEALRLHSMEELKYLPSLERDSYKALGNAVNVKIVSLIAQSLIK